MSDGSRPAFSRWWLLVAAAAVSGGLAYAVLAPKPARVTRRPRPPEATAEQVHQLCAACHAYPPPDSFPRSAWRKEVKQGYDFFHQDLSYRFDYPPLEAVLAYYENRAPDALPLLPPTRAPRPPTARFERRDVHAPDAAG